MTKIKDYFDSLTDLNVLLSSEKEAISLLSNLRWGLNKVVSPFDEKSKVYQRKDGSYRCKNTGNNFSVFYGTVFHKRNVSAVNIVKAVFIVETEPKEYWVSDIQKECNVSYRTAKLLVDKIMKCADDPNSQFIYSNKKKESFVKRMLNKLFK